MSDRKSDPTGRSDAQREPAAKFRSRPGYRSDRQSRRCVRQHHRAVAMWLQRDAMTARTPTPSITRARAAGMVACRSGTA